MKTKISIGKDENRIGFEFDDEKGIVEVVSNGTMGVATVPFDEFYIAAKTLCEHGFLDAKRTANKKAFDAFIRESVDEEMGSLVDELKVLKAEIAEYKKRMGL